ncbi:MAG TPA: YfhO family protein [Gemmatimonadota bacterium]|nr:YfhO family protein [Gemmatimonadota bacterium]
MTRKLPTSPLAWFALASALVTAWLYRAFIFDPDVMLFGQEMIDQSWQLREFAVEEVKAGRGVPLWNPYLFGGLPYVAILPGPVFYPTTALYFVMPLFRAIGWTFVLHTWLAGLFAYFAARSLKLSRSAAVVTGFAFMLSGFVVSMNEAGHDGRMFAMVLIPLAFGLLERGLQARRLHWFLGMGLVVACQIFTPHLQSMYFSSLALSLYALVRVIWIARDEGDWRPASRTFGYFALGFAAAAAIGMGQLLPNLELRPIAVRGGGETGYAFASSWAMPPQELAGFVLPDLIGSLGTYWGSNPFKQHTEYLGIVPAALAVIGLTGFRRDRRVGLIGGIALLCILYALGAATPVHRIAYAVVPVIRELRAASLMLGPACFFAALLAGFGWQRVLDARAGTESTSGGAIGWGWVVGLSAPVLLLGLGAALAPEGLVRWVHTSWFPAGWPQYPDAGAIGILRASGWLLLGVWSSVLVLAYGVAERRLPKQVVVAVLLLLVLDLARVDDRYIRTIPPAAAFAPDELQQELGDALDPVARVFPLREQGGYAPNDMMLHDIRSVTGMQNFRLEWTDRLIGGPGYENLMAAPALWPVLDVDYVITRQQVETPLLEAGPSGPRGTAWRVLADGPHAWFPARVEAETDPTAALQRLAARPDPATFALVAGTVDGVDDGGSLPAAGQGRARVTSFTPNEVVLDVEAEQGGLLVVSEIYHPNWRASVDDAEVPVHRVDIALRGVEVPAGSHQLRFTYTAGAVRWGLLVGLLALLACLVVIGTSVRRHGAVPR